MVFTMLFASFALGPTQRFRLTACLRSTNDPQVLAIIHKVQTRCSGVQMFARDSATVYLADEFLSSFDA